MLTKLLNFGFFVPDNGGANEYDEVNVLAHQVKCPEGQEIMNNYNMDEFIFGNEGVRRRGGGGEKIEFHRNNC